MFARQRRVHARASQLAVTGAEHLVVPDLLDITVFIMQASCCTLWLLPDPDMAAVSATGCTTPLW
jgi:hypothetical protein